MVKTSSPTAAGPMITEIEGSLAKIVREKLDKDSRGGQRRQDLGCLPAPEALYPSISYRVPGKRFGRRGESLRHSVEVTRRRLGRDEGYAARLARAAEVVLRSPPPPPPQPPAQIGQGEEGRSDQEAAQSSRARQGLVLRVFGSALQHEHGARLPGSRRGGGAMSVHAQMEVCSLFHAEQFQPAEQG
jgi:hypothetical protein